MITNPSRGFGINSSGQPAPVFCLKSEHWCILGLDTGFDSLNVGIFRLNPSNKALKFPDPVINWLTDVVKIQDEKRGIIVLTHHQYVSGFKNEDAFTEPAKQLKKLLGEKEIIWIWGHEHRFAIYGKYNLSPDHISAYGRSIGHGGMPAELIPKHLELSPDALSRKLILYDKRHATHVELIPENKETGEKAWVEPLGYNGYATIDIDDLKALITYYSAMKDSTNHVEIDQPTFNELWEADATTNTLQFLSATDLTVEKHLTYLHKPPNPLLVGQ